MRIFFSKGLDRERKQKKKRKRNEERGSGTEAENGFRERKKAAAAAEKGAKIKYSVARCAPSLNSKDHSSEQKKTAWEGRRLILNTNTASQQKQSANASHSTHSRTRQTTATPERTTHANRQSKTGELRPEISSREHRLDMGRKKALCGGLFKNRLRRLRLKLLNR